jgi:SAM-dependent methyltransferase
LSVKLSDAVALIRSAVEGGGEAQAGVWADLGAGGGTFTRALAEILGAESRIYAVDAASAAVAELEALAKKDPRITALEGDFTGQLDLPPLDGMLLANALHFHKDAGALLARLAKLLRPGGRAVLVEYDRRAASRWVPHPIAIAALPALAKAAGLGKFTVVESRPSNYEGVIYTAVASRGASVVP